MSREKSGITEKVNSDQDYDPSEDEVNSIISSLLTPLFRLIHKSVPEGFRLTKYFYYVLGILVLLAGLKLGLFNIMTLLLLFSSLLVLEIFSTNFNFFKGFFARKNSNKVMKFLSNIEEKNLKEITEFLQNNYNCLEYGDLVRLADIHGANQDIHKAILSTQNFNADFVDFLIKNKYHKSISDHHMSRYVLLCSSSLNKYSLSSLSKIKSIRIKGALVLRHPFLFKNNAFQWMLLPIRGICVRISNILRDSSWRVFLLFSLSGFLMIANIKQISAELVQISTISQSVFTIIGYYIASMIVIGILLNIISFVFFRTAIALWGIVYRKQRASYTV